MRYLTKSRFKLARECPRKLYYLGKRDVYKDNKVEDTFLESLAEGGFQVGKLATFYYPDGHNIEALGLEESLNETNELLKKENVIIYEAAIKYNNLFVRVDILVKNGNQIDLIEVKAKSCRNDTSFTTAQGDDILSVWKPYIEDIAFQNYVAQKAFVESDYEITPYLLLVNKDSKAVTDKLNQKFKISKNERGRTAVTVSGPVTEEDLSAQILKQIDVSQECDIVYSLQYPLNDEELNFDDYVETVAYNYENDIPMNPIISNYYKTYEFDATEEELAEGYKSGWRESLLDAYPHYTNEDFKNDTIFKLWNFRINKKFLELNKIFLHELRPEEIGHVVGEHSEEGMTRTERQWLQIEKSKNNDDTIYINKEGLKKEIESWTYPLHFIDFETASPAIPFNKGKSPYQQIAFQFSHHMVHKDGTIEHKAEYLNTQAGVDPNYDFLRELKKSLENDRGTIFKYSNHENTILRAIMDQLNEDPNEIDDRDELISFIKDITYKKNDYTGSRNMVDLLVLVQKYYYDPRMKGSNSIKVVLPSILNSSKYIQEKYSKSIYGAEDGIKSLNFQDKIWVKRKEDGTVQDPYKLLPPLFEDIDNDFQHVNLEESLNDGGAAMMAYYRLQFTDLDDGTRKSINDGLLRYCELDTLAMVMIYEAWFEMIYGGRN